MNKENQLLLQSLHYADSVRKFPSLPDHARVIKKYKDNGANALTNCIKDFLNFSGWQAERISTTGRYVVEKGGKDQIFNRNFDKGKYIKGTGTNGSADISATIKGRSVKIEVKYGKDIQSQAQKDYQTSIESAGGVYVIARDFDSWKEWYDNFIKNIK